ncbi:MAG: HEAT repeat domain-containing protein [Deltaproteobacteria bacterium]|nr:HEAT repeat domain-containing protein [Deltaproteobacteria bacterium]
MPSVKWGAITAIGEVVGLMADEDLESARNIIRRLMWNLNDESGGIGWGSPEAMAEILFRNKTLATEYHHMLLSYINEEGNFQESELMQRGVLWGIGRIAGKYPELVKKSAADIIKFLDSDDPAVRAYSARLAGLLGLQEARFRLESLLNDEHEIQVFIDSKLINCRVKNVVSEAIERLIN